MIGPRIEFTTHRESPLAAIVRSLDDRGIGWAAYDLLRDVAQTGDDFARGVQPELMSAAFYDPLDTAMPDQFFATSMIVSPALRGLVGYRAEASRCRVTLSPQLPADWNRLTVRRLPTGCGSLDVTFVRDGGRLQIDLARSGGSTRPVTVALEPSLPLGASIESVSVDGRTTQFQTVRTPHDVSPSFELPVTRTSRVVVQSRGGAELVPQQTKPRPGDASTGLRLVDWREENARFVATVEGSGAQQFRVRSGLVLRAVEGGTIISRDGDFFTVSVTLRASGEQKRVVLTR